MSTQLLLKKSLIFTKTMNRSVMIINELLILNRIGSLWLKCCYYVM